MKTYTEDELNDKIAAFLTTKAEKFPELGRPIEQNTYRPHYIRLQFDKVKSRPIWFKRVFA